MFTVGSVSREVAAARFPFLAVSVSGRRNQIKDFTHRDPDFVFWIYPDGRLHDAKRSHRDNVPRGYESDPERRAGLRWVFSLPGGLSRRRPVGCSLLSSRSSGGSW